MGRRIAFTLLEEAGEVGLIIDSDRHAHSLGEGYYALANLDTSESIDAIVPQLNEALEGAITGLVSRAIRDSAAGHTGDYLGLSGKDILCSSASRIQAAQDLAARLNAGSADILMLLQGKCP